VQHLHHSRQLALTYMKAIAGGQLSHEQRRYIDRAIDLHRASIKFLLPDGGRLFDDLELRALGEAVPLKLPFPCVALEYRVSRQRAPGEPAVIVNGRSLYEDNSFVVAPKRVVYASQMGDTILVDVAFWTSHDNSWRLLPTCAIPVHGYLLRQHPSPTGRPGIAVVTTDPRIPNSAYSDEVGALLCFLNALQCANVHTALSPRRVAVRHAKAALQFDDYHILTVEVPSRPGAGTGAGHEHRSPREHLRRGHIRRLADGRRVWVNATVVASGQGSGKVGKAYALSQSRQGN
jgi:hypothetical protein